MELRKVSSELYPLPFSFDHVFQIVNEDQVPVGLVYISELNDHSIYIEWLEILTVFHGRGYLRKIFCKLAEIFEKKEIHFECPEDLLMKYKRVGCIEHGISDCTSNYVMTYIK